MKDKYANDLDEIIEKMAMNKIDRPYYGYEPDDILFDKAIAYSLLCVNDHSYAALVTYDTPGHLQESIAKFILSDSSKEKDLLEKSILKILVSNISKYFIHMINERVSERADALLKAPKRDCFYSKPEEATQC